MLDSSRLWQSAPDELHSHYERHSVIFGNGVCLYTRVSLRSGEGHFANDDELFSRMRREAAWLLNIPPAGSA